MKTSFPPTTRRRALQTVLNQKLLAAEANKRGVSAENLIKLEVDSKVAATSDDQVSAYYQGYPNEFHQPLEDVRDKISEGLMQRRGSVATPGATPRRPLQSSSSQTSVVPTAAALSPR
jgi:hypothetical protein